MKKLTYFALSLFFILAPMHYAHGIEAEDRVEGRNVLVQEAGESREHFEERLKEAEEKGRVDARERALGAKADVQLELFKKNDVTEPVAIPVAPKPAAKAANSTIVVGADHAVTPEAARATGVATTLDAIKAQKAAAQKATKSKQGTIDSGFLDEEQTVETPAGDREDRQAVPDYEKGLDKDMQTLVENEKRFANQFGGERGFFKDSLKTQYEQTPELKNAVEGIIKDLGLTEAQAEQARELASVCWADQKVKGEIDSQKTIEAMKNLYEHFKELMAKVPDSHFTGLKETWEQNAKKMAFFNMLAAAGRENLQEFAGQYIGKERQELASLKKLAGNKGEYTKEQNSIIGEMLLFASAANHISEKLADGKTNLFEAREAAAENVVEWLKKEKGLDNNDIYELMANCEASAGLGLMTACTKPIHI